MALVIVTVNLHNCVNLNQSLVHFTCGCVLTSHSIHFAVSVRPVRSKECEMNATLRETLSLLYSNFAAADALGCICYQAIMFKLWVCK